MIEYEKLYNIVQNTLSEKRFNHCKAVVKRAIEYAEIYGEDKEIVKLVAISHDIAKELNLEEEEHYISYYHIPLDDIEKANHQLLHAKIGAYLCKDKYDFTEDMVNAIMYHTTGRKNMSLLEKIIYLADATEENRKHGSTFVDVVKKDIDKGMVELTKREICKLLEKGKQVHVHTIECYNDYLNKN